MLRGVLAVRFAEITHPAQVRTGDPVGGQDVLQCVLGGLLQVVGHAVQQKLTQADRLRNVRQFWVVDAEVPGQIRGRGVDPHQPMHVAAPAHFGAQGLDFFFAPLLNRAFWIMLVS